MGQSTPEEALAKFFELFDKNGDGMITFAEFEAYYADIGSLINGDDSFRELLQKTWGVNLETNQFKDADTKRYIGLIREKLITSTIGVQDEFKLRSIFVEFQGPNSNIITQAGLDALLLKLNIEVPQELIPKLFNSLDKNKTGYIEFDEFENFILYNPYK